MNIVKIFLFLGFKSDFFQTHLLKVNSNSFAKRSVELNVNDFESGI